MSNRFPVAPSERVVQIAKSGGGTFDLPIANVWKLEELQGRDVTPVPILEIASLDSEIKVPAGDYIRCLRVNTLLAGGDGGSALRYYAPGVGYVHEEYSSETSGSRVSLTSFHLPGAKQ